MSVWGISSTAVTHHCLFHTHGAADCMPSIDAQSIVVVCGDSEGLMLQASVMGSQQSGGRWELCAYSPCVKSGKSVPEITAH